MSGVVDVLSCAFTPDRAATWDALLAERGLAVKVRHADGDGFAEPDDAVARMDELGVATTLLAAPPPGGFGPACTMGFDRVAATWEEVGALAERHPGRFAALLSPDPGTGMAGVRRVRRLLEEAPWAVGLHLHTHSWDRPLDHADLYPYYALCAELDVPFSFQAGASGGLAPSACGHPIGIDRPALYFPEVRFVASHLGWPWVDEAIAMALKFPHVFLGTASYPPAHWPDAVVRFAGGPGRDKVLFATNFPTVGLRKALRQRDELDLADDVREAVFGGTARRVFTRLA